MVAGYAVRGCSANAASYGREAAIRPAIGASTGCRSARSGGANPVLSAARVIQDFGPQIVAVDDHRLLPQLAHHRPRGVLGGVAGLVVGEIVPVAGQRRQDMSRIPDEEGATTSGDSSGPSWYGISFTKTGPSVA